MWDINANNLCICSITENINTRCNGTKVDLSLCVFFVKKGAKYTL